MILTEEILEQGKSRNGSWSTEQIRVLGETMTRGWRYRLLNRDISEERIQQFLDLKDFHLDNRLIGRTRKKKRIFDPNRLSEFQEAKAYLAAAIEDGREFVVLKAVKDIAEKFHLYGPSDR
jgi:hypothetical protein